MRGFFLRLRRHVVQAREFSPGDWLVEGGVRTEVLSNAEPVDSGYWVVRAYVRTDRGYHGPATWDAGQRFLVWRRRRRGGSC